MFATVEPIRNVPHPLFAGGDGDLMNALCHGTEDPYDQSALFNMDVSNIPYPSYDLIVYLGANSVHGGDRTGKIVLNGGAEQDFTLPGGFNGFVEITNATTPGNYIVFRGLTNPSLNLKVWGNGFNHLGPAGFQIVNYGTITGDTTPAGDLLSQPRRQRHRRGRRREPGGDLQREPSPSAPATSRSRT